MYIYISRQLRARIGYTNLIIYRSGEELYRNIEKLLMFSYVAVSPSSCSSLDEPHTRHLQHTIHGAANKSNGDATSKSNPNPAKIPITCVLCQITDARE